MKRLYILLIATFIAGYTIAQTRVVPAEAQKGPILLRGGVAHLGNGEVISNSLIGFDGGKLTVIADATNSRIDVSGYEVIDISGKHVYPGFILLNSGLGLVEVSAVDMTRDFAERGSVNPSVRSIIAYNTDSELIPTYRFNGIMLAQVTPSSGLISGTSSVVQLDAWNWEDAAYRTDDGLHISWPRKKLPPRWWQGETDWRDNDNYESSMQQLEEIFNEAVSYKALSNPMATNLKLEAVAGIFDGSKSLYINVNDEQAIVESVKFAQKHGVKSIRIVGGRGSYNVAEFLKEQDIPVILEQTHDQPRYAQSDYDEPYKLPGQLTEKGVTVAMSHSGSVHGGRNLPFYVGTAVAFGMEKEEALKLVTANPAEILGLTDKVGTLEEGKDATLFVSEGDAFDMRTNKLSHAFINGRQIQVDARQQWLYKKFGDKYGHGTD